MNGRVYLVGAGPGDPGLITARGLALLRAADAVVHDRLVAPELLREARGDAEIHDVGKVPGKHSRGRQREISRLLVALARQGKMVVRLKGGDPFVFGRGGEEAEACAEAGVPFEVVPGVTSPVAVPAYAGIPLTHRSVASSFAVVTGHEDPARAETRIDWQHLAAIDTLVILMGIESLPIVTENLLRHGRSPATPVAIISRGTYPEQETLVTTLGAIREGVEDISLRAPATIVVGEVVRLRDQIRWFDNRPLHGVRVLLPRTREKPSTLADHLAALGAHVTQAPAWTRMVLAEPDRALDLLTRSQAVLFTDATTVEVLLGCLAGCGRDVRALHGLTVAASGPGTASALEARGLRPDILTGEYLSSETARELETAGVAGRQLLLLRQADLPTELPRRLEEAGCVVHDLPLYRLDPAPGEIDLENVDVIAFPSSGSVRLLADLLADAPPAIPCICMGESTAATARSLGFEVARVAEEASFEGLARAVVAWRCESAQ